MSEIRLNDSTISYRCEGGDTLLKAGLRSGHGLPYECSVGSCGTCKFELLEGEMEVLWETAPGLTERDRKKGRMLACQCRPKTDCLVKLHLDQKCEPQVLPRRHMAELTEIRPVTYDIYEFCFTSSRPAEFLPGQYALLELPQVVGARAYSMANLANEMGEWRFQVRRVPNGAGSTTLFDRLSIGNCIPLDGPYGLAYLRTETQRDIVCIAGGSGLAPMLSIARGMVKTDALNNRRLHFFYGGRGPQDICGEVMLRELPGFNERIFFHPIVSTPELAAAGGWKGRVGFVHDLVEETLINHFQDYEFYLAGPPPMVQAAQDLLQVKYKVSGTQVHFDRFF